MASPRDFPTLRTQKERRGSQRGYHVCPVCRLTVEPRNSRAHAKKCSRLKREDPALWLLWKLDMNGVPPGRMRQLLRGHAPDLVRRGHLAVGPLTRRGEWS